MGALSMEGRTGAIRDTQGWRASFASTRGECPHCGAKGLLTERAYREHQEAVCVETEAPRG